MRRILLAAMLLASLTATAGNRGWCRFGTCTENSAPARPSRPCEIIWAEIQAAEAQLAALPPRHVMTLVLRWRISRLMAEYAAALCNEPC